MTAGPKDPPAKPPPDPREARLAKALRENLRRRKALGEPVEDRTNPDKTSR
jgi:hypothetical protein